MDSPTQWPKQASYFFRPCFIGQLARRWQSYVNNAAKMPPHTGSAPHRSRAVWNGCGTTRSAAYRAATVDCNQIDIWGSAFAIYIGFVDNQRRQRLLMFLRDRYQDYVWHGQVRHLLRGEYWERLLKTKYPIKRDTYQNGAYWATASGWVLYALAQIDADLARPDAGRSAA